MLAVAATAGASPPTTTALLASSTSVANGSAVTLTATVQVSSGAFLFNGQVAFCDATAAHCTDIHRLGVAPLIAGYATYKFIPGPGKHSYNAVFLGINPYAGSTSSPVNLTVTPPRATTTTLTQSGTQGNYTELITVSGAGSVAPSGTISILDTTNANYILGTGTLIPSAPSLSFFNSQNPAAGSGPRWVATADFNSDGIPDLAISNDGDNTVSILLGHGDGTFAASPTSPLVGFSGPAALVASDFNNDGIVDLAVLNTVTNQVWVMLGSGGGSFGQPLTQALGAVGGHPVALAVGDFDGDGTPDLAVVDVNRNTVLVLLGDGYGHFTTPSAPLSTGNGPASVVVADFNNDGKQDLAITSPNDSTVTLLFGAGNGQFPSSSTLSNIPSSTSPYSLGVADLNGDGNQDLAVANSVGSSVTILLGRGDGTFLPSAISGTGVDPESVRIGDMNGDGLPDLVTSNATSNSVSILLGNGDGSFQAAINHATGYDPQGLALADFNGDGVTDLVAVNYLSDTATVLLAQPEQAATVTIANLSPVGGATHQVIGSYSGDTDFAASTSAPSGLIAQKVSTSLNLTASPPRSVTGQQVVLTATLTPVTAQNHSTDGDSVTFSTFPGRHVIGTGNLSGGVATLTITTLPAGTNTTAASYAGDANFTNAIDSTISYTVTAIQPPTCTLSVAPGASPLSAVATTHCIDPQQQALTETLNWGDGTTVPLASNNSTATHTYAATGRYTVTLSATDTSGLSGTATENIDPNQSPVCSLSKLQGQAPSTPSSASYPITIYASCTDPQGQPLTLSLDWGDGTVVVPTNIATNAHTYTSSPPSPYNVVLAATDTSGLTGSSAPQPVQIVPASPTVAGNPANVTSAIPPPTILPAPTQVTFICASVSVPGSSQTVLPTAYGISCTSPSVPLSSSSPTPVDVTITTTAGSVTTAFDRPNQSPLRPPGWAVPLFSLAVLPLVRRKRGRFTAGLLAVILCLSLNACGGHFEPPPVVPTPTGKYYITLVETVVSPSPPPTGFIQTSLIVPLSVTAKP